MCLPGLRASAHEASAPLREGGSLGRCDGMVQDQANNQRKGSWVGGERNRMKRNLEGLASSGEGRKGST